MITATPALSSPPSSVVPSVVMIVWPCKAASSGLSAARITRPASPGSANVAARVVADHLRLHAGAGRFGRGVEVRIEARSCSVAPAGVAGTWPARCRNCVLLRVGQADGPQFVHQQPPQFQLARRAGIRAGRLAGRGIDADIAQKPLEQTLADSWLDPCLWS